MHILRGVGASAKRHSGRVRIIRNLQDASSLEWGEVAVLKKIARDMLPEIKRAGAVVADYGGLTSHAAITLRELGIPCVLGTEVATEVLREGMIVTVDGKTGNIYRGVMDWVPADESVSLHETATRVMVNLNFPWLAEKVSEFADGVGSVRIENMVIETGKHPYLLLRAEFEAVRNLLDAGYSNLELKFPFLRDLDEYRMAVSVLEEVGVEAHRDLRVGASVETPSIALQVDELLAEGVDFVSLGMSDLTMCSLVADRRSTRVAGIFDLSHPAVLKLVRGVVDACHGAGVEVYAAGYAATSYMLVGRLIEMGVDGISTSPDKILKMKSFAARVERSLILRSLSRNI